MDCAFVGNFCVRWVHTVAELLLCCSCVLSCFIGCGCSFLDEFKYRMCCKHVLSKFFTAYNVWRSDSLVLGQI